MINNNDNLKKIFKLVLLKIIKKTFFWFYISKNLLKLIYIIKLTYQLSKIIILLIKTIIKFFL